ncbi:DNA cytosine methyltransferase [Pandoraea bronchicola]|uniref:DNA cytosine methyltransferase n=1 Tax=Pandoraea bronchicola TaxID=2508287 RepID=UPI001FE5AED0|nr:DNA cytosine methyltransferase [Pandoraea bronchicola]
MPSACRRRTRTGHRLRLQSQWTQRVRRRRYRSDATFDGACQQPHERRRPSSGHGRLGSASAHAARECERLQGFPDDYTPLPGAKAPDGPRYKALGNRMAANVMPWIGERIQRVENLEIERAA